MVNPSEDEQSAGDERLHDLIAEYHDRVDQGETLDQAGFTADHPELESELSRYFENVATLESLAGPTAGQSEADPNATVISGETHDGGFAETMIENSGSGNAARISKDAPLTQFGRYRIRKELGRGAMGAVYLAHDEQLDREIALKIPKFETDANADLLERFYREARAAAALQHSGLCPVYDVGELDGQHYITMGFIKGRPLRDFTKSSKRQAGKQVARVIRKVALAMAEAHEHNIVHRDLKPANIMINLKNEPVVMDFGLARRSAEGEEQLTHTGTVIGTPAYMSPEQVDGDNENVGPHSDIYSLGVIFYEMLTGQLPFQGNLMSILKQIALTEPKPPAEIHDDIDPSLQDICLSMMAKKSEDRPASMSDVARDLTQWLQGRQVVADESEPLETSRVPGQQAAGTDEPTVPVGQTGMPDINVGPAATFTRTTPRTETHGDHPKNRKFLIAGALGGAALLLAGIVFIVQLGKVTVQITVDDPSLALKVDGDEIVIEGNETPIRLSAGTHELIVKQGNLEFAAKEFKVTKDGKNAIHVVVVGDDVFVLKDGQSPPASVATKTRSGEGSDSLPPLAIAPFNAAQAKAHQEAWAKHLDAFDVLTSPDWKWTEPVNLGPEINSPGQDTSPSVTRDGLTMVFASPSRDASKQNRDLFMSTRKTTDSQWSSAVNIVAINSARNDLDPAISPDGRTLVFTSIQPNDESNPDLWISTRETSTSTWSERKNLGPNINSPKTDWDPHFSEDGLSVVFQSSQNGSIRRYVIRRPSLDSVDWSPAEIVPNQELPANGRRLFAGDRVTLFLPLLTGPEASTPVLLQQIRNSKGDKWSTPKPIAIPGNESVTEKTDRYVDPHISHDGRTIWFAATRPGGFGDNDIWMSRRVPINQAPDDQGTPRTSTAAEPPPPAVAPFDAAQAKAHQEAWAKHLGVPVEKSVELPGGEKMTFILIPPGEFMMGSPPEEQLRSIEIAKAANEQTKIIGITREGPQHRVRITAPFYIGKYETTQAQWQSVIGNSPTDSIDNPVFPVVRVSWNDVQTFFSKLNTANPQSDLSFLLPTEAQWEYACRAGTSTPYYSGENENDLSYAGWFTKNSRGKLHPVGALLANGYGLHDMHGNVQEWCSDWLSDNYSLAPLDNPVGPTAGQFRIRRGGGWKTDSDVCRSARRGSLAPEKSEDFIGFRVTMTIDAAKTGRHTLATGPGNLDALEVVTSPDWEWSEPVNLGPGINSPAEEGASCVSCDGLTLLFASRRDSDDRDIWMATRSSIDKPWSPPRNLKTINDIGEDNWPTLSPDGLTLVFFSSRPGGQGGPDLWISTRDSTNAPWTRPSNLGPDVNSSAIDMSPQFSDDGLSIRFQSTRTFPKPQQKYVTRRSSLDSLEWTPAELFNREGLPNTDMSLHAGDRVALFYGTSRRDSSLKETLLQRSRSSVSDAWGSATPVEIPGNGEATRRSERFSNPHISHDGRTIWFAAERPGGHGDRDIWMSRRVSIKQVPDSKDTPHPSEETKTPPSAVAPFDAAQAKAHQKAWAKQGRRALQGGLQKAGRLALVREFYY